MRPVPEGWLNKRPFKIPKKCRHCNGPYIVVDGVNPAAEFRVVACAECDLTERWPARGK